MGRGKFFLIIFLTGIAGSINSQTLSHQVLVPLAGVSSAGAVSYSQTVGETAVTIVGCYDFVCTQGFQQPGIKFSDIIPPQGNGVNVYPNPAVSHITFELFGDVSRSFRIDIMNITGTVVASLKRSFSNDYWLREDYNIESLIRGFYLVRILSDDGMINRTFRIEKM